MRTSVGQSLVASSLERIERTKKRVLEQVVDEDRYEGRRVPCICGEWEVLAKTPVDEAALVAALLEHRSECVVLSAAAIAAGVSNI